MRQTTLYSGEGRVSVLRFDEHVYLYGVGYGVRGCLVAETSLLGTLSNAPREKAFAAAIKLPKKEQDRLAKWLLAKMESERRWDEHFSRSSDQLAPLVSICPKAMCD